ncbi:hypothetical protein GWK47_045036 [Chionoecetes opilio]|uniref:Uncharacterized protein n=1 Tax=Chionoecetes opilio TaxID=41210 RepID=A0A8J4Y6P7_CHIOP|nr:hypothetical protein GWK47_045036 [Chionoecetes opilio]
MSFNEEKFEMLRHGQNHYIKEATKLYTEGGQEISIQPHVKCLGVHISEDCSFHHHIAETVRKAIGMAGWVLRTFTTRETLTMLTLWKTLIQPLLDYCSQLCSPHKRVDIQPYITARTGRKCLRQSLPTRAPERIKTLLASSLIHDGPKTFNTLPKEVRSITGCPVGKFKSGVEKFLWTVPDEAPVLGYTARCRTSNTIPDQVDLRDWDARIGSSSGPPWM